jgi:hypothetical protein
MMRQPGIAGTVVTPGAQRSPKMIVGSFAGTGSHIHVFTRESCLPKLLFFYTVSAFSVLSGISS